jgi:hypothetical protein
LLNKTRFSSPWVAHDSADKGEGGAASNSSW